MLRCFYALSFSSALRDVNKTGDYFKIKCPSVNWRTTDVQGRRDSQPLATQRPSQHPNRDERAIRRAKWWSRLFTRRLSELHSTTYYSTVPPILIRYKFKQNKRRLIKTMTDRAHAGVRTDRPERSYLFSAAKEMYYRYACDNTIHCSLRERSYKGGYQYGNLLYFRPLNTLTRY